MLTLKMSLSGWTWWMPAHCRRAVSWSYVKRGPGNRDHPPGDDVFELLAVVFANAEKLGQVGDKGDELKICNDNPALRVVELFHRLKGSRAFLDSSRGISEHIIDSHSSAHKNPQVLGRFHNPDVVLPFRRKG